MKLSIKTIIALFLGAHSTIHAMETIRSHEYTTCIRKPEGMLELAITYKLTTTPGSTEKKGVEKDIDRAIDQLRRNSSADIIALFQGTGDRSKSILNNHLVDSGIEIIKIELTYDIQK